MRCVTGDRVRTGLTRIIQMREMDVYKKASTKPRTKYTPEQLELLEGAFLDSQYPDTETLEDLAEKLDVSTDKVSVWFQNRRSKFKRQSKDSHVAWMRKQLYNTDMRSSCRLSHKDGNQHVLSPPDRQVTENTLTPPNSNLHYMPHSRPENNTYKPPVLFSPTACPFPFPACYGPVSASSSVWDQMDIQQRTRFLTHLMTEQTEQNHALPRPSCQNQSFSRPSCQYTDRQTHGMPQFPTSCSVPSLTVPGGLGF